MEKEAAGLILTALSALVGALGGHKLNDWRLKTVEKKVADLAQTIEGPDGLQVKVALLEGR